jgi:hypothetical protein
VPEPGDGEVLVDVAYAGANFYDILMVQGKYQVCCTPLFILIIYIFFGLISFFSWVLWAVPSDLPLHPGHRVQWSHRQVGFRCAHGTRHTAHEDIVSEDHLWLCRRVGVEGGPRGVRHDHAGRLRREGSRACQQDPARAQGNVPRGCTSFHQSLLLTGFVVDDAHACVRHSTHRLRASR